MSSKSLFLSVGVSAASAESVAPAVYTQENTDEYQTSSDAGNKQQSLLTENSGSTSLPCLLTIFHRTKVGTVETIRQVGKVVLFLNSRQYYLYLVFPKFHRKEEAKKIGRCWNTKLFSLG